MEKFIIIMFLLQGCGGAEDLANAVNKASVTHDCSKASSSSNDTSSCSKSSNSNTSSSSNDNSSTTTTTIDHSETDHTTISTTTSNSNSTVPAVMQGNWVSACDDGIITQIQFSATEMTKTTVVYSDTTCTKVSESTSQAIKYVISTSSDIFASSQALPILFQNEGLTVFENGANANGDEVIVIGNSGSPVTGQEVYTKQ